MEEYTALVQDTLLYLQQEKIPFPNREKQEFSPPLTKKKAAAPTPEKKLPSSISEKKAPPLSKEIVKPPAAAKQPHGATIPEKIRKHLPHIELIDAIPQMGKVAIVCSKEEDLPFLKNLAKAIQGRFLPVSLLKQHPNQPYTLVIAQEEISTLSPSEQILLDPIEEYQNNTELKKQLWAKICHHLSQVSS